MTNINVEIAIENACLMLMQDNKMIDCLFINKYYFDTLSPYEQNTLSNLYKMTYLALMCPTKAKQKMEQTIEQLQQNLLMV